jgi:hypothetical protein
MRIRIALVASFAVSMMAGIAIAHDGNGFSRHYTYKTATGPTGDSIHNHPCAKGMGRTTHGIGYGYTQARTYSMAYDPFGMEACAQGYPKKPGYMYVKYRWWKRTGTGDWTICKASDWKVNPTTTANLEVSRTWGSSMFDDCKIGYFVTEGGHKVFTGIIDHKSWWNSWGWKTEKHWFDRQ